MASGELVQLKGRILRETDSAILLHLKDETGNEWFPLSTVERITRFPLEAHIWVESWIAKKKGLI